MNDETKTKVEAPGFVGPSRSVDEHWVAVVVALGSLGEQLQATADAIYLLETDEAAKERPQTTALERLRLALLYVSQSRRMATEAERLVAAARRRDR